MEGEKRVRDGGERARRRVGAGADGFLECRDVGSGWSSGRGGRCSWKGLAVLVEGLAALANSSGVGSLWA